MESLIEARDSLGRIRKGNPMKGKKSAALMGENNPFWGRKHTKESMEKMRANHPLLGKKGAHSMAWKGGGVSWAKREVKKRDNYTCRECFLYEPQIVVVDHVVPRAISPGLSSDVENMVTLCPNCHARKTLKDMVRIRDFRKQKKHE